jgi:trehalose 6-phosphate synthase
VVLVSNRGPVQHRVEDGRRVAERGAGGLVTALSHLTKRLEDATWICAAMSDEDIEVARENPAGFPLEDSGPGLSVRMVEVEPEAQRKFYAVVSNPMLWFIQHYLWDHARTPNITDNETDAFDHGYATVNRLFAEAVIDEVEGRGGQAIVMVHDYHFYLLPELVRSRQPDVFLHHFVHTPWPQPDSWRVLPPSMREPLLHGLLGNDVVAFHTERYARNFLLGCQELLGLGVDMQKMTVDVWPRTVHARWYPISVDADDFAALAASPGVRQQEERLAASRREHLLLRVDRTDPSKNILRGFLAYDLLLDRHPELAGRITFLALLQPSRQDVVEYAQYRHEIEELASEVNLKHGTHDWKPIDLRLEENLDLVVAAYKLFDVLLVNGIFDGMNLVAKEAVLVNENDGVLALSENTGAHEELGAFSVTLHPFDIPQQAEAIYAALTMPRQKRRARREACVGIVKGHDVARWLREQMEDVRQFQPDG